MSRFDFDNEEGIPWDLWETIVSNALGGRKGQAALAELEDALVALPEPRLISGHLAADGAVCAVGAFIAHRRAVSEAIDLDAVIEAMSVGLACYCGHTRDAHHDGACHGKGYQDRPCYCDGDFAPDEENEDAYETAEAGERAGLSNTLAWHLAYLNDEQFSDSSPEERYERMLRYVRRAQGKEDVA